MIGRAMEARISLVANDIDCVVGTGNATSQTRVPLDDANKAQLESIAARYRNSVVTGDANPFLELGKELFTVLNRGRWASRWAQSAGDRILEIAVDEVSSDSARLLLNQPWELLANDRDFFAADPVQTFQIFRSIQRPLHGTPRTSIHADLAILFMAAMPGDLSVLEFEEEESRILDATARLDAALVVEESGCASFLGDRLAEDGPFEAVHISCHGNIDANGGPVLALESPDGHLDLVDPGQLTKHLGERKPPLLFLSACRTAEAGQAGEVIAEPYIRELVRAGVPNVVGWDGAVFDVDASSFAGIFYGELSRRATIPYAAAIARRQLLVENRNSGNGKHWHLARVYSGPDGAGPCTGGTKRSKRFRQQAGYKEFLDIRNRRVRVATRDEFVGRRRQIQNVLRALVSDREPGVLVLGIGNAGKSSLAARVANRLPKHSTVVVYERYDAPTILDQLLAAVPAREREGYRSTWSRSVADNSDALHDALEELLKGPFAKEPTLLIVDDLERILMPPDPSSMRCPVTDAPGQPDAWRSSLSAIIRAFERIRYPSHLLLTSRYEFSLPDKYGNELADLLMTVQVPAMHQRDRLKQWRAAARLAGLSSDAYFERAATVLRARNAAGGNPGLQEILCRPILAGEVGAAEAAISAIEMWRESGKAPGDESAAAEFFGRVSFDAYREALTSDQSKHLLAATIFSEDVPIPFEAMLAVGKAMGISDPEAGLTRLMGLGLMDDWGKIDGIVHQSLNPLARPLAP